MNECKGGHYEPDARQVDPVLPADIKEGDSSGSENSGDFTQDVVHVGSSGEMMGNPVAHYFLEGFIAEGEAHDVRLVEMSVGD